MNEDCVVSCCWSVFYPSQYVGRLCPLPEQTKLFRSPLWGRKSFRLRSVGKNLRRGIPVRGGGTKKATRVGCLFSTSGLRRRRRAFCGRGGDGRYVGDGELFAGVAATGAKDAAAVGAGHSCAEAVFVHTLAAGRLECSFHDMSILYFSRKDCKGSNSGGICQIFLEISRLRSK